VDCALGLLRELDPKASVGYVQGVQGPELMQRFLEHAERFKTEIVFDHINTVDFSKRPFTLHCLAGQTVRAHAVIIATGARANYLGLESEDQYKNRGVSACAVCDGALPRFRNKPLIVVGGGDSAVEEASFLTKYASTVHMVHRRDKLRASMIMQERALNNSKIKMEWNQTLEEVLGSDKDGVTGVLTVGVGVVGGGADVDRPR